MSRMALGIVGTAVMACLAGCTVHTTSEPVGYAEVTSVPVDYSDEARYPHTTYSGRTVYYVDNRWGYRERNRWVYYRSEPPELYRYRTTVRQAPPAARPQPRAIPAPRYQSAPQYQPAPPVQPAPQYQAPPATRVR